MQESAREIVSGAGGVRTGCSDRANMVTHAALLYIRTVLAYFHNRYIALLRDHLDGLFRIEMRIGERLVLVSKDNIHILLHQILEESMVLVYHIIGCQIERDHTPGFFRQTDGFLQQFMVLHQIALQMEYIEAVEGILGDIVRA